MPSARVKILDAAVDPVTEAEALRRIGLFLRSDRGHQVVTLNSEMVVACASDAEFRQVVEAADLVVADGMGVLCAASYLRRKRDEFFPDLLQLFLMPGYELLSPASVADVLPEKISGIDFIDQLCACDFMAGRRIYLLGAEEGIAQKAGKVLKERYPRIEIAGAEAGIDGNFSARKNDELIARVNEASPDLIFVALGAPRQEEWIASHLERMPGVRVGMGVGGSFDVLAGKVQRAPLVWQTHGLEWLWRLLHQPKRLGRIYNATCKLAWLIFRSKKAMIDRR